MMAETLSKHTVLTRLQTERANFEAALAQMDAKEMESAQVQDDWTVKDILAHISAWEAELLRWLEMSVRGEPPDIPAPGTWSEYMHQFNARTYERNRKRPIAEVQREFQGVYASLFQALADLPEDPHDDLWSLWYGGEPPWGLLATFYEHYRDHAKPIQDWLRGNQV